MTSLLSEAFYGSQAVPKRGAGRSGKHSSGIVLLIDEADALAQSRELGRYISLADKNSDALRNEIRKFKGLDVRVLKPRGFIIPGRRSQLVDEVMEDNFRLLNSALKNVEVILYDDLLGNLKNFLKRLKKS